MRTALIIIPALALLNSCVSLKIHEDLQAKYDEVSQAKDILEEEAQSKESELADCNSAKDKITKDLEQLQEDADLLERKYKALNDDYTVLKESYETFSNSSDRVLSNNANKIMKLLQDLENSRALLNQENDKLRIKEKKIAELESLMKDREMNLANMKKSLSDALRGFEGKGLTVEQRNGRVYVSLENRLLFSSGSWSVNTQGREAVRELAKVLVLQKDISILIEGHTDSDAFGGNGNLIDNWDLSVKRATAIVRIIMEANGVDATKITAAGRSKYLPVATNDTAQGKAKNRRIEVIIEPDLSKIEAMLNSY